MHLWPCAQRFGQLAPQSTSLSCPFWTASPQLPAPSDRSTAPQPAAVEQMHNRIASVRALMMTGSPGRCRQSAGLVRGRWSAVRRQSRPFHDRLGCQARAVSSQAGITVELCTILAPTNEAHRPRLAGNHVGRPDWRGMWASAIFGPDPYG
jgi:hypothetical protein